MFEKIKIETKSAFSFTGSVKDITAAIMKAVTVTGFSHSSESVKEHFMVSYKSRLFVIGYSEETFICIHVKNVDTEGNGSFGFNPPTLTGMIKNRSAMEFSFDNGSLAFKLVKGKYSGSMKTNAVTEDHAPHMERMLRSKIKGEGSAISGNLLDEIRKGVKIADLKDYYNDSQILCAIRIKKGLLEVSSHDNFHMAYFKSKVQDKSSFELAIPITTFKLLERFISDEDEEATFHIDSKHFRVIGKTYMLSLPPIQVDDDYFDRVPGYIASMKNPLATLTFNGGAITTVGNMFTISDDDSRLSLSVSSKGTVKISLSTESGTIEDGFKTKDIKIDGLPSVDFMIDPRIFSDLFSKVSSSKEVPMRLYSKRNKGVSSCFMISAPAEKNSKALLVGTYYEE